MVGYEQPDELLTYISAESKFGLAFETCRADGMDRMALIFRPRMPSKPTAERSVKWTGEAGG